MDEKAWAIIRSSTRKKKTAPVRGRIDLQRLNQQVFPGNALYHSGLERCSSQSEEQLRTRIWQALRKT